MTFDRQREEYERYERQSLAEGRCPDSGELLMLRDDGRRYCIGACDCFGYTPEEYESKGGRP